MEEGENARCAFLKSLEIAERLAAAEPQRADYQVDLATSLYWVGSLEGADGKARFRRALALLEALQAAGRLAPVDQPKIADLQSMLAAD